MFKKDHKTVYRRIGDLLPKQQKPSNKKRIAVVGIGSAVVAGIAGAFVKNKERGQ